MRDIENTSLQFRGSVDDLTAGTRAKTRLLLLRQCLSPRDVSRLDARIAGDESAKPRLTGTAAADFAELCDVLGLAVRDGALTLTELNREAARVDAVAQKEANRRRAAATAREALKKSA